VGNGVAVRRSCKWIWSPEGNKSFCRRNNTNRIWAVTTVSLQRVATKKGSWLQPGYSRYWVVSQVFEPSKVPTKMYILSCPHISFKINMSLTQTTRALSPRGPTAPSPRGGGAQFENLWANRSTATLGIHHHHQLHFGVQALMPVPASKVSPRLQRMALLSPSSGSTRCCPFREPISPHVETTDVPELSCVRRTYVDPFWSLHFGIYPTKFSRLLLCDSAFASVRKQRGRCDFIQFYFSIFFLFVFRHSINYTERYVESLKRVLYVVVIVTACISSQVFEICHLF
jgi:hypothetical protein